MRHFPSNDSSLPVHMLGQWMNTRHNQAISNFMVNSVYDMSYFHLFYIGGYMQWGYVDTDFIVSR